MKSKLPLALLMSALAAPVLADNLLDGAFSGAAFQLAQVSPAERRMMRERWEQASPEERTNMRRLFQERMQQFSPEQRPRLREQGARWMERMPATPSTGDLIGIPGNFVGNFGTGYEQRRPTPSNPDDNAGSAESHGFVPPAVWPRR